MRAILTILLTIMGSFLFAQQKVTGKIVDADSGEGLIGAHVYLMQNWRKGTTTDIEGVFALDLTQSEMVDSLVISYVGFREQVVPVSGSSVIKLRPVEVAGKTVVVTAEPLIAEEFKYMEINKIEIYTNPAAKADPLLAVNALPSSTTTDESANISLRGSSPIETGLFLNNVPIYDGVRYSQLNGIGTFSIFNTAIIQDVTVFPGNPPLEFGNATSGIIAIETDERILDRNTNSLSLSLANIGFSREQKINERQSVKIFTNWQPSGPIKALNEEALEDIKSFTSNDLGIYWYGSGKKLNWKVLSYSITEGYRFNFEHPSFQGDFNQRKNRTFTSASVEKPVGKGTLSVNNGFSYSVGDFDYSNVAFQVKKRDWFSGINYILPNPTYSVKVGMSYDYRNAQVSGSFHEYFYALGPEHPTLSLDESLDVEVLEGFGYAKFFLTNELTLGTGFRKNIPIDDQEDYLSGQGNISYTAGKWVITSGVGLYHKSGLFENTGEPFTAHNFQKTLDIKLDEGDVELALSFFDKNGEVNGDRYDVYGAEFFTNYRFSTKLRVSGSVTLLESNNDSDRNFTSDLTYFVRGNLAYTPGGLWTIESILVARQGTLLSDVANAEFDANLNAFEPTYAEVGTRLPYYANIGVSVSKVAQVTEKLNVIFFASVNNVFDRENIRGYNYNRDYTSREPSLFSLRTSYFGAVFNF